MSLFIVPPPQSRDEAAMEIYTNPLSFDLALRYLEEIKEI